MRLPSWVAIGLVFILLRREVMTVILDENSFRKSAAGLIHRLIAAVTVRRQ